MPEEKEQQLLLTTKVFDVRRDWVDLPSGRTVERFTVVHPGAVVILPRTADGTLILLRQYRHSVQEHILEFPAGTLEPGEEPLACAQRELIEECGFAAGAWRNLGTLLPAPGFCNEVQHLYFAEQLSPNYAEGDEDEILESLEMTVEQVLAAVAADQIRDAKSLGLLLRARLLGLL